MMNFPIVIRNTATGMEKSFETLVHVAEFLIGEAEAHLWTGHECLGPLPEVAAPAQVEAAAAPEVQVEAATPVAQADEAEEPPAGPEFHVEPPQTPEQP